MIPKLNRTDGKAGALVEADGARVAALRDDGQPRQAARGVPLLRGPEQRRAVTAPSMCGMNGDKADAGLGG